MSIRDDAYEWLTRCSAAELQKLEDGAHRHAFQGRAAVVGSVYLVLVGPSLALAVLVRAVERSHWVEIVWWVVLAAACLPSFLAHRKALSARELMMACIAERHRRDTASSSGSDHLR